MCLAFPDVYDIGMSHLGTKIIYSLLNKDPRIACERAFAPWLDMEAELRARDLPLVSLESQRPLHEFDVLGVSLQYELTFTNMLTLLDLGGIPLHAADRADDATLVLVGGPTASHPEPIAPFIDAAFVGEAEELLGPLVLAWAALRKEIRAGDAHAARCARRARARPSRSTCRRCTTTVDRRGDRHDRRRRADSIRARPARISRAMVRNLDEYPFPSDAPVPYAEAVFERASVEIARGCTEGCRFCQAGMIYRPVRERSPQSIAKSLLDGVDNAGYDETGLTCLSTADFSSITPLVKSLAAELRKRGVSMSVASLRAYGLNEDLLDELALTRISGLTFAPEAGTQRMRDVVNKNVTEAHIEESSRRVFSRGWHRLKLYFMIGLPTEEDDDVRGIVETGLRMLKVGRELGRPSRRGHGQRELARAEAAHAAAVGRAGFVRRDRAQAIDPAPHRARRSQPAAQASPQRHLVRRGRARARRSPARAGDRSRVARRRAVRRLGRVLRSRALAASRSPSTASTRARTSTRARSPRGCRGITSTSASKTASCSPSTARP